MKINGKSLSEPYVETIVFPRNGGPVALKARAVLDYKPFEQLVPMPEPPERVLKGGEKQRNVEDPNYKEALVRRFRLRVEWMQLQSLLATEGLQFDVVKLDDPDTWGKLEDELSKSGFTPWEVNRIYAAINSANGLNDAKIKQAENDFLASQAGPSETPSPLPPSPIAALRSIQSGEPANAPA